MKRKIISLLLCLSVVMSLCGCEKQEEAEEKEEKQAEVVLITDYGTINDGSYNQGAWKGVQAYYEETGVSCNYLQPEDTDKDNLLKVIRKAVDNGARIIICTGYLFEEAVYEAQTKYPDVSFVFIDGKPHNEDYSDETIAPNVMCISFAEEQAGFLAGYAAVREGYTGLGFMGGKPMDSVIRYGYGFVQGADYAAIEMGVNVHVRYIYTDTFSEDPIVEKMAKAWYEDSTEVIFACGGEMGRSVMRAAESVNGKVIGVDVDQSSESETVITSATKCLETAVYGSVKTFYEGNFIGGELINLPAVLNGICLPMQTSRFQTFDDASYWRLYSHLVDGMIVPYNGTFIGTTQELELVNTDVTYIMMDEVTAQ